MSLKERAGDILLKNPGPEKISRGAFFSFMQTALTPAARFSTRSEKRLSLVGYGHAWRFFRAPGPGGGSAGNGRSVFTSLFAPVELVHALGLLPEPQFLLATSHCCDGTMKSFSVVARTFSKGRGKASHAGS